MEIFEVMHCIIPITCVNVLGTWMKNMMMLLCYTNKHARYVTIEQMSNTWVPTTVGMAITSVASYQLHNQYLKLYKMVVMSLIAKPF